MATILTTLDRRMPRGAAIALILAALACGRPDGDPTMSKAEPEAFNHIDIGESGANECSPVIEDDDFRGFLIAAPERVTFERGETTEPFGTFADVPICISYALDVPAEPLERPFDHLIELVARDVETGEVYRGAMITPDNDVPPPASAPPRPEDLAGLVVAGELSPNLLRYVELPAASATYQVHVEFNRGRMHSNAVTVELVMIEPEE